MDETKLTGLVETTDGSESRAPFASIEERGVIVGGLAGGKPRKRSPVASLKPGDSRMEKGRHE